MLHARNLMNVFFVAARWLCVARLCATLGVSAAPVVEFKLPAPPPSGEISTSATTLEPVAEIAAPEPVVEVPAEVSVGRPVTSWLEAQIELARRGFSSGAIDGVGGAQSAAALRAFQETENLAPSGVLDVPTREKLLMRAEPLTTFTLSAADCARLQPLSDTWLGKSAQTALDYETALELVAERAHTSPNLVKRLNPEIDWSAKILPGTVVKVPALGKINVMGVAARLHVKLADRVLQVRDAEDRLLAHFPVSIARKVEKRPVGELHVTVAIANPDYTFDPAVFPESEEAQQLGRKLILPPGPNNPVGVAWIGLDRPGYGIHGTPKPEQVGRTESHGCFRLANWDAQTLLPLVWVGLTVVVDP